MKKRILQIGFFLGLFFALAGCMSEPGDGFYALPQLPGDYLALQQTITEVMNELGAEYAAPTAGNNVQTIQMQDLDGDGERESAVAFFRVASAEKPLKIYIFRQDPLSEEYKTAWILEGDGTSIYSVAFEDLGGTDDKELVVSWQISTKVHSLAVYSLQRGGDTAELMRSGYTKTALVDLDRDNEKELALVQLDTVENNSRVELYNYVDGLMVLTSAAPLSLNVTEIQAAKVGSLKEQIPALFVTSDVGVNGARITDVITLRDGALTNLTLDAATGLSVSTIRYYTEFKDVNGMDINSDGILELPIPKALPLVGETGAQMYQLDWYQYDQAGEAVRVCSTFHCYEDSWYLVLPESWPDQVTVARKDSGSSQLSERAVSFYHYSEGGQEPEEFLTIYRLTGSNRTFRAAVDGRVVLFEGSDVIYAAKFRDAEWDCGLDSDTLRERFHRVKVDWSDED